MADSQVITLMRGFKRDLLHQEQAQMQAMASRWLNVERRLDSQMSALAYEMEVVKRDGGTVTPEMLMTQVRYRELLVQLNHELEGYTDYAGRSITDRQRQLARLGIKHGEQAIRASGLRAGFNRLPIEAVENLIGFAGDGAPLANLLTASWPLAAQGMTQELINGVALGYNPRKVAKLMAQGATGSLDRMMVISRTESLRAYRTANLDSYTASGVVSSYKRLATHDSRVCAACLMDEGTVYTTDELMPLHPQCRCTLVPVVDGIGAPTWKAGADWFEEQSPERQRDILGKGRYYAWQNGDFELDQLVTVKPNAVWGDSLGVTPLKELSA
jgi:SPP1 gp7 family putative phage head morphogenesis protein